MHSTSVLLVALLTALLFNGFAYATIRQKRSDDLTAQAAVVEQLSQRVDQLTAEMTAQKNEIADLRSQLRTMKNNTAFYVHYSQSSVAIGSRAVVVYDVVVTNNGNGYDIHTGIFTAPVSGLYALSVGCTAFGDTTAALDLVVDGTVKAACYSSDLSGQPAEQAFTQAPIHLAAGNKVWIKNRKSDEASLGGPMWTTFSGFLIQADQA